MALSCVWTFPSSQTNTLIPHCFPPVTSYSCGRFFRSRYILKNIFPSYVTVSPGAGLQPATAWDNSISVASLYSGYRSEYLSQTAKSVAVQQEALVGIKY